jgi:hypothetical protein
MFQFQFEQNGYNQALQPTPTLREFLCRSLRSFYGTKNRSVPEPLNLSLDRKFTDFHELN